jgi:hypothetical protein
MGSGGQRELRCSGVLSLRERRPAANHDLFLCGQKVFMLAPRDCGPEL